MLTGTKPYPSEFNMETFKIVKRGKYIRPRKIDKKIPPELAKLIHKMIRPNPKKRFQNIDGVIRAVKRYLRHYNTHDLRVYLARAVGTSQPYTFPFFIPKDMLVRRIRKISLLLILAAGLFTGCWKAGLIHKTILKGI